MDDFEIHSADPPAVLMERLTARASDWHESRLPASLRMRGVYAIRLHVTNDVFRLRVVGSHYRGTPMTRGRIDASGDGSSLRATFTLTWPERIATVVWLGWFGVLTRSWGFTAFAVVLLAIVYAISYEINAPLRAGIIDFLSEVATGASSAAATSSLTERPPDQARPAP